MTRTRPQGFRQALDELKSLHDGDLGVVDVIAFGKQAIPALRALLFGREPSGLYQVRCRAVEALAGLGANSDLVDFLSTDRAISDPVELLGEDAVINAAARALAGPHDERVFELLLRLAKRSSLTGVIGALGAFGRAEAIPLLVDALEDDASRATAEAALRRLGKSSRRALIATANLRPPSSDREGESSLRRRRSALKLLIGIGIPQKNWSALRPLMRDGDAKISVLACKVCLMRAPEAERRDAICRLISLLPEADWLLREEIEDCLVTHFEAASEIIAGCLRRQVPASADVEAGSRAKRTLLRVQERGHDKPGATST